MKIVALTGLPRTGKDTLANMLVARDGYVRLAYATALYEEVAKAFNVTVAQLASHEWKTAPQRELTPIYSEDVHFHLRVRLLRGPEFAASPQSSREILQLWGTEYRRAAYPSYWIDRLISNLGRLYLRGCKAVVVSDCRTYVDTNGELDVGEFQVLDAFAMETGGSMRLAEIVRAGAEDNGHSSNRRFPDHLIYARLTNNRTPEELYFQAQQAGILV